jgi:hypothetical protein
MPYQINNSQTAEQNFVGLINTGTQLTFTGAEFTRGTPSVYTPESPDTSNTEITLTAVSGSGFTGTKTIRYRRLELGHTKTAAATEFSVLAEDDRASMKQKIATEHNLILSEFDLVGTIPAPGDDDSECTIEAVTNSIIYFGTYSVTLLAASAPPVLDENTFQLRDRTSTVTYASVYLADVPTATIMGNNGNTSLEEWSTAQNPSIINGAPDRSIVSFTDLGTAGAFFATRQPATEGPRYWEVVITKMSTQLGKFAIGTWGHPFADFNENLYVGGGSSIGGSATYYETNGSIVNNNGFITSGPALQEGDIVGIIASNPSLPNAARFYVNGVFAGAADITAASVTPMVSQKEVET